MSNVFRDSFNHLLDVFGDPTLGVYYKDTSKAVVNSYGEITGGTVYLVKKCPMRGKVVTDPLEVKTVTDNSASYVDWTTLTAPAVFKCSATDLIKGGVLDSLGNYEPAIDPDNPSAGTGTQGLLNMYVLWRGVVYDVLAVQKGIVYGGDTTALYLTTAAVYNPEEIAGRAELVIQDNTPVDPPKPPEPDTYNVVVDSVLLGAYAVGATVTLTTPSKDGYEFKGWTSEQVTITNNTFIMPECNVTVTSVWEEIPAPVTKYTVTVDGVLFGSYEPGVLVTLTVPTKDGYNFNGWSSEQVTVTDNTFTMPSENVVITSLWTPIPVTPVYYVTVVNPNDGVDATQAGVHEVTPYQFEDGSYAEPAFSIKAGSYYALHNFSEWRVTSGTGTFSNAKDADTVFYPTSKETTIECVWVEVAPDTRRTVTFVGIDREPEKVNPGDDVTVHTGTKEGYEFSKWTSEPAVTFRPNPYISGATFTMPDSDVTVTANWTEVFYTVNFYLNGDSTDSHALWETLTVKPGVAITAPADPTGSPYAPEDKVFTGWYTAADGGTEVDLSAGVTADTDLYAHWKGVDRTVTFDTDGGNTIEPRVVEDGMPIGELPVPVKAGFKFDHWTDELGRETITADTIVYYDMTIYAVWMDTSVVTGEAALIDKSTVVYLEVMNFTCRRNKASSYGQYLKPPQTLGNVVSWTKFGCYKSTNGDMPPADYTPTKLWKPAMSASKYTLGQWGYTYTSSDRIPPVGVYDETTPVVTLTTYSKQHYTGNIVSSTERRASGIPYEAVYSSKMYDQGDSAFDCYASFAIDRTNNSVWVLARVTECVNDDGVGNGWFKYEWYKVATADYDFSDIKNSNGTESIDFTNITFEHTFEPE